MPNPAWPIRRRSAFLVGGLPQYLLCLDQNASIERNILDPLAPLSQEPLFLIREELREVGPYHAVLNAIASGCSMVAAIAASTGLPERSLHYYLQQLVSLGCVQRRHPLDGGKTNPKQLRFRIGDPLLRFWFRFVFPNQSHIKSAGPRQAFRSRIAPALDAWFGHRFEHLCREALPRIYAAEGVSGGFQIGEYWNRQTQIDVVGLRDDHLTDLGECKWGAVRSAKGLRAELDSKIEHFPNQRGATLGRRLFTRNRPRGAPGDERRRTLADLYALPAHA